jgi:alkylhydroperoxidase family enzyme
MARVTPTPEAVYAPLFGEQAPLRVQIYAQRPEIAKAFVEFGQVMRDHHVLPARLLELVRLRVAFHNQCRSCMSVRYAYGVQDGLTEGAVCSLERPEEAEDLTDAERAAIAYADLMATNHLDVDDSTFQRLREHFGEPEIMELCFNVALYVGFGRMAMSLDMVDDLPEGYRAEGIVAPWGQPEVQEIGGWDTREAAAGSRR